MGNSRYIVFLVLLLSLSCSSDDDRKEQVINTLADLIATNEVEIDNVIACASGSENENEIIAYMYPRPGATELRYFETTDTQVDKNNYSEYAPVALTTQDVFNGFLKKFTRQTSVEKWVIISFRESEKIHLSNPIRLKHKSQNTLMGDTITIDQTISGSPIFNWETVESQEDAIYFQVVSHANNDLISGTYTFDTTFQFYNLDNVVLNITDGTPSNLIPEQLYHFTLMAVSEDNWVNYLELENPFLAQ